MKKTIPKVGQIFSRIEYDYYKARMNQLDWFTLEKPKRIPRKLKKALKAKSKPLEFRVTSVVKSGSPHRLSIKPRRPTGYDGSRITHSLLSLQEQEMWDAIAKTRRENPWLSQLNTINDGIVGKALFTSTVEEGEGAYKSMWVDGDETKESGLKRFFIPSSELYKNKEDENTSTE